MYYNPMAAGGANQLVRNSWMETDNRVLQKIYVMEYSFCILGNRFARLKLSNFLFLGPVFPKRKIICFLFQTMNSSWVCRKCFQRFITNLKVWADIIKVLFFQLVSITRRLHSKFGSFFTEVLKILNNNLMQYRCLFTAFYPLRYAKRLVA